MFSFTEVYNMPIHMRTFYLKRLVKEQQEELEKARKGF
jgi:hypothetical protein